MITRLLGTAAATVLVLAATTSAHAVVPSEAGSSASRAASAAASPRIGYVYGAGLNALGGGIVVYAQQANGTLTPVQQVADGDAVHSTVIVHLRGGLALYDLTRSALHAFRITTSTGRLTPIAVPTPPSPVSAVNGLGVYDPLAHGLPGQPMLVTGTCGAPTADHVCPFRFETFLVNPVTGALAPGKVGGVSTVQVLTGITSDGLGRMAFGVVNSDGSMAVEFARVGVVGATTGLVSVTARGLADNATGQNPQRQSMGSTILITRSSLVEFPAGPLWVLPDHPGGWVAYAFGSVKAAPYETRISGQGTASTEGVTHVLVGENSPMGGCQIESFGAGVPGLGGVLTPFPCGQFVNSMFFQGGYVYVGRYGEGSISFHDTGLAGVTPTAQSTVPVGVQIYSWTGFLLTKPSVSVPATVSLKVGIPLTIGCQQTCSGSTSASITIAGSTSVLHIPVLKIKPHAAGTFLIKLLIPASMRGTLTVALKKHRTVSVATTTKVVAGTQGAVVVKVSHLTP
jgi:hypothetical protein